MRLLALLLLVPSLAAAQGLNSGGPGTGTPRKNWAFQSNTMSTGAAMTAPWGNGSATPSTVAGPPGPGTWLELTSTTTTGYGSQTVTVPTTNFFLISVYAVKASGSGAVNIAGSCGSGNASVCACGRSGAGTCATSTAKFNASSCISTITDLGTTVERIWVSVLCVSSSTAASFYVIPGDWNSATGTTRFWGAQLEVGKTKPSKLCQTTTAAKTCTN